MEKRNMKTRMFIASVIFLGVIICIFLQFFPKEPPKIRVTFQGEEISYAVGKNEWNGSKYDRLDVLTEVALSSVGRIYVPEGESVEIEFMGKAPKSYTLTKELYGDDQKRTEVSIHFQNKKGSFVHTTSDLKDIDDSTIFVGYRLTCQWGEIHVNTDLKFPQRIDIFRIDMLFTFSCIQI